MDELFTIVGGLLVLATIILTPIAAFTAFVRSRRIRQLEGRLECMEQRIRMLQSALPRDGLPYEPRTFATAKVEPRMQPAEEVEAEPEEVEAEKGEVKPETYEVEPEPEEAAPFAASRPEPSRQWSASWPHDSRAAGVAWEERIGGSLLNKAGALLVVVGVSLFVGWSMVRLGPAGRVGIGLALSGSLLAAGIVFARNPAFRVFALGLAAAGWGGIYVTTYAMHGLEAARLIDDPVVAAGLLLAVAAGMIVHALWERIPMMVAVAYAAAFAAVAMGPASMFASAACLVLAATLLVVSHFHDWPLLAVGGIVCTYGTLAFRFPPHDETPGGGAFLAGHAMVWACWAVFEAFDILMLSRGRVRPDAGRTLLPLNLCGLLGVAMLHWPAGWSRFDLFLVATTAAYGLSTLCRVVAGRRSSFAEAPNSIDRMVLGGYEASLTIVTAVWAWALWTRFETGWRLHAGLVMEAEFLFLAGLLCGQRFMRGLSAAVFTVLLVRFMLVDVAAGGTCSVWGLTLASWTPAAIATVAVLAINAALLVRARWQPVLSGERLYGCAATGLVAFVLGQEAWQGHNGLGPEHIGFLWLVEAWILLQLAFGFRLIEAAWQGCLLGLLSLVPLGMINAFPTFPMEAVGDSTRFWIWLLPAAAILYASGWQVSRDAMLQAVDGAENPAAAIGLFAGSTLLMTFLWHALPSPLVALGWGGVALLLFQVGLWWPRADLRWHAFIAAGLAVGRLFLANFTNAGMTGVVSHRVLTVVPVILLLYEFAARLTDVRLRGIVRASERAIARVFLWAGTLVLVVLMRFELGRVLAVAGWAVLAVVLLLLGRRRGDHELRWQSHVIALITFARSWGTHFYVPEAPDGLLRPWVLGGFVVAALFAAELLCPPDAACPRTRARSVIGRLLAWLDDRRRSYYCILGTVLLGVLLIHEMPSSLLTAALGIEGGVLLALGFVRPDRSLRLCGLAVMGICVPKLFLYDLRHLETPYRILSFVLLGLLLLVASWIYTRFKSRLHGFI